jgi:Ca2+-binding RTX toxin-like protein
MGRRHTRLLLVACLAAAALIATTASAVAAIRTGDILVANPNSPNSVVKVDPVTGQQTILSSNDVSDNDFFQQSAYDLALDPRGTLYVIDYAATNVIAIDPRTGQQTREVTQGNLLQQPLGLDRDPNGTLVLADDINLEDPNNDVVRVAPGNGQQTLISSNSQPGPDLFRNPYDVAVRRNRQILVADYEGTGDASGALIDVNRRTGVQAYFSNNTISGPDLFEDPYGVLIRPSSRILVTDGGTDAVVAVNRTGQQSLLSGDPSPGPQLFFNPHRSTLDLQGRLLVVDFDASPGGAGAVFRVNPRTGEQTVVTNSDVSDQDLFVDPTALIVVPPKCGGQYPTIYGTPGRDVLAGTPFPDVIAGLAGNDVLKGLGKGDRLCGGRGRDRLRGGKGRDRLLGGPGRDRLLGGPARDRLRGGAGRDFQRQ